MAAWVNTSPCLRLGRVLLGEIWLADCRIGDAKVKAEKSLGYFQVLFLLAGPTLIGLLILLASQPSC